MRNFIETNMKKTRLLGWLFSLFGLLPMIALSQTYDTMWKDIDANVKKDLPKSVINMADKIYQKAKAEKNIPQMMKAYLVRAEYRIQLTPDSLEAERNGLQEWAQTETDEVGRAVLNCILGDATLSEDHTKADEALRYFRLSLKERELLGKTSAKNFRPMTVSGKLSEKYFSDNMYDLLARQAIRSLSDGAKRTHNQSVTPMADADAFYNDLISFYEGRQDKTATFLCKESQLLFRYWNRKQLSDKDQTLDDLAAKMFALIESYQELPECADAYLKVARFYAEADSLVKAVEVANKGLAAYPQGEWTKELKQVIARAETPALQVRIPFIYPKYEAKLRVTFANLTGVTLELYRLKMHPSDDRLNTEKEENLIKSYGTKVSSKEYALKPSADYSSIDTILAYTLPDAGIYALKQIPHGKAKSTIGYSILYVSPYQFIYLPIDSKQSEVTAIDRLSGCPVPHAELVVYDGNTSKLIKAYQTDSNGKVVIPKDNKYRRLNVRTAGNDFMSPSYLNSGLHYSKAKDRWAERVTLFTDRAIYRPGQTVHVSGLFFEQNGDSVRVLKGKNASLRLYKDAQTVGTCSVSTDDFGVISADFSLPEQLLPGTYWISGERTTHAIRIEEYKRPTFDVKFTPYEGTYAMGDSVCLQAKAQTFAGAPVRNARVKYRFVRSYHEWFRRYSSENEELKSGEIQTDADGKFTVGVTLVPPPDLEDDDEWLNDFYNYELTAEVTDGAGETQSANISLPVSNRSLCLSITSLEEKVMREKQPSISFRALNLSNQPVDTVVSYRVYKLLTEDKKGDLMYEGKANTQQSFVPSGVWSLPSGSYIMEATTADEQGRECKTQKTFSLFSKEDKQIPDESVCWIYADDDKFSKEDPATFYIGTNEENAYLFIDVYSGDKRISSERTRLNKEMRAYRYTYRDEYGDGIKVVATMFRTGVHYSNSFLLKRPNPVKELSLSWETFRDKLQPGNSEEWRIHIVDKANHPVKANLMTTLYDASLDKLQAHKWNFNIGFNRSLPNTWNGYAHGAQEVYIDSNFPYVSIGNGLRLTSYPSLLSSMSKYKGDYTTLMGFFSHGSKESFLSGRLLGVRMAYAKAPVLQEVVVAKSSDSSAESLADVSASKANQMAEDMEDAEAADSAAEENMNVSVRENFAETAFFYPNLRTDSLGNVTVAFTVPDALTEWKFMGFAHNQDVDFGFLDGKTVTQKQFMVQPNMPRFVRKGDRASIAASLVNLSASVVSGTARIELSDPMSGAMVYHASENFSVSENETGSVRFTFDVPENYDMLVCKITAAAGEFSDGEQHYLPVLTDKQWVTETIPVQLNGEGSKTVQTASLFNKQSASATDKRLTVELTANPDWYAVQALPTAGNPQNEDALSWGVAYYTNTLAKTIVDANPRIKQVFEAWKATGGDKTTLLSNLERNQDLKNILLKETPWLSESIDEAEQKQRIALLFDLNTMQSRLQTAISKLTDLQNADGSWSWYKGMSGSRYITTSITEMLARLKAMNVSLDSKTNTLYNRAIGFLAKKAKETYTEMRRIEQKNHTTLYYVDESVIHYLYVCALDETAMSKADKTVNNYFIGKLENKSTDYTIFGKSRIAIVMQGAKKTTQAKELIQSVKEHSVYTEEMGRYFDTRKAYYSWRNYKIPTEVAAMEAIFRVEPDAGMLNEMKQWLLKQKQTQAWESSVATADAVYAFLCMNGNELISSGKMTATVGDTSLQTPDDALGYARRTWTDEHVKTPAIQVERKGTGIGWGAVYAQYLESMEKLISNRGNGVSIERTYLLDGERLTGKKPLHVGDKLTVRLTVKADRDMDFIQVKDERAACMEPSGQLSGYTGSGRIGFYKAGHDASTEFFIDRMPKGTYQIEYTVYIDRVGTYQSGIATIQSAYSPEFSGHTEGMKFTVVE